MTLEITETAILLNSQPVSLPVPLQSLTAILGDFNRSFVLQYNTIYTWDDLGLFVHSKNGQTIEAINLHLREGDNFQFTPKSFFSGTFIALGIAFEKKKLTATKNGSAKEQTGPFSIYYSFNRNTKEACSASITLLKKTDPESDQSSSEFQKKAEKYKLLPAEGAVIEFKDFNFKLAVINQLMYRKKLLSPAFDVYEFASLYQNRKIDIEEEGYDIIPEVKAYFEQLPISIRFAETITELYQDGGDEIYGQLCPFWDGEDDLFNIRSAEDASHFPLLRKVTLFYDKEGKILEAFRQKGISTDYL